MKWVCLALATLFLLENSALACNVPVFRYALERWRPDLYRVTLLHRGPLADNDQTLATLLSDRQDQSFANFDFRAIDVGTLEDESAQELSAALGDAPLPRLVLQYPRNLGFDVPIWAQPLSKDSVAELLESPSRRELVRRLAAGQTAVWVIVECGDAAKDQRAAELVEAELKKLATNLKLPELTESPDDNLLSGSPLRIEFSSLRMPRSEAERALVEMLVRSEPDLAERTDPLVFPVFGRGRALFGLVGAGITADNIRHAAEFLVGACSCEAKEQNPGFDLLLAADWPALLAPAGIPDTAATSRETVPPAEPELVPIPRGSQALAAATPTSAAAAATPVEQAPSASRMNVSPAIISTVIAVACLLGISSVCIVLLSRRATAVSSDSRTRGPE